MTEIRYGVTSTSGWAGRVIRWATHSTVNHAFLVDHDGITIEAQPGGMRYGHAKSYPRAIYSEPVTGARADAIWADAESRIGTPYGWLDIAAIALVCIHVPTPRWALRRLAGTRTLICSQAVCVSYAAAGISLGDKPAALTTPGDLLDVIQHHTEPVSR